MKAQTKTAYTLVVGCSLLFGASLVATPPTVHAETAQTKAPVQVASQLKITNKHQQEAISTIDYTVRDITGLLKTSPKLSYAERVKTLKERAERSGIEEYALVGHYATQSDGVTNIPLPKEKMYAYYITGVDRSGRFDVNPIVVTSTLPESQASIQSKLDKRPEKPIEHKRILPIVSTGGQKSFLDKLVDNLTHWF